MFVLFSFYTSPSCHNTHGLETDLIVQLTSGQKSANNQWDQVDDFNWLKAEASPNWKTITDEDERFIPREFWETTVHGGPLLGTDDILREAGIV